MIANKCMLIDNVYTFAVYLHCRKAAALLTFYHVLHLFFSYCYCHWYAFSAFAFNVFTLGWASGRVCKNE